MAVFRGWLVVASALIVGALAIGEAVEAEEWPASLESGADGGRRQVDGVEYDSPSAIAHQRQVTLRREVSTAEKKAAQEHSFATHETKAMKTLQGELSDLGDREKSTLRFARVTKQMDEEAQHEVAQFVSDAHVSSAEEAELGETLGDVSMEHPYQMLNPFAQPLTKVGAHTEETPPPFERLSHHNVEVNKWMTHGDSVSRRNHRNHILSQDSPSYNIAQQWQADADHKEHITAKTEAHKGVPHAVKQWQDNIDAEYTPTPDLDGLSHFLGDEKAMYQSAIAYQDSRVRELESGTAERQIAHEVETEESSALGFEDHDLTSKIRGAKHEEAADKRKIRFQKHILDQVRSREQQEMSEVASVEADVGKVSTSAGKAAHIAEETAVLAKKKVVELAAHRAHRVGSDEVEEATLGESQSESAWQAPLLAKLRHAAMSQVQSIGFEDADLREALDTVRAAKDASKDDERAREVAERNARRARDLIGKIKRHLGHDGFLSTGVMLGEGFGDGARELEAMKHELIAKKARVAMMQKDETQMVRRVEKKKESHMKHDVQMQARQLGANWEREERNLHNEQAQISALRHQIRAEVKFEKSLEPTLSKVDESMDAAINDIHSAASEVVGTDQRNTEIGNRVRKIDAGHAQN